MLTVADLHGLVEKPNLSRISLKLLQDYNETYLKPYSYKYHLGNGTTIDLVFEDHRFCHLLGIETVAKGKYGKNRPWKTKPYRGNDGYQGIKDEVITCKSLRQLSGKFSSIKDKIIFFYMIPHLIVSPDVVINYKNDPSVSFVECKILIFDIMHGVQVHLGLEVQEDGRYYPRTFLIERITDTNKGNKFTANQPDISSVKTIEVSEVSTGNIIKTITPNPVQVANTPTTANEDEEESEVTTNKEEK